jgi:chromosome segregation ATPase
MARTGLYKSDVKKARDALIAQGTNPSVDAVRVALGNTGSKTTIHKYLRELEEEDGGANGRTSISEALQDLVGRLAAQLQAEADTRIETVQSQSDEQVRRHADALGIAQGDIDVLKMQLQRVEASVQAESAAHAATRAMLQQEAIARHTAEQLASDLKERLAENESHRASLEEKHQHAREALEHYRQSVKEQRDQDQRRHEQQVQQLQAELRQLQQSLIVKQDDVTRLNQEGARLVAELSHTQKDLYDQQTANRQLVQKLDGLAATEQRCKTLETQLAGKNNELLRLEELLQVAGAETKSASGRVHDLELALSAAQATCEVQRAMMADLSVHLAAREAQSRNPVELPAQAASAKR